MGKILGIAIKNYGSLKDITMGQVFSQRENAPLGNMVAIIGPSGNGKSTLGCYEAIFAYRAVFNLLKELVFMLFFT